MVEIGVVVVSLINVGVVVVVVWKMTESVVLTKKRRLVFSGVNF